MCVKIWKTLLLAVGSISLLYYVGMVAYAGIRTAFSGFWLAVGVFGIAGGLGLGVLLRRGVQLPGWLETGIWGILILGIVLFLLVEGMILSAAMRQPEPGADYVIVLGAQVRGTRVTRTLRYRLNAAAEYLRRNPETQVIVSGGQGTGEDISEAAAMAAYLLEQGIAAERIIQEDRSTNTEQNIRFSRALMEGQPDRNGDGKSRVAIATSGFHVFRALRIARKQGLEGVIGIPADNDRILAVSYYVRECLAVVKDFLVGNI